MKNDYTHITMILDRSGSMQSVRSDIIGGFNQLIAEQQAIAGQCTVTLVQFDSQDPYEILRDFAPVKDILPLGDEYRPRGNTPLYDAVGRGIVNTGERLGNLPEHERPAKVVFVILTDGLENASKEYDAAKVAAMTKEQTEKYGWQFVYLGANQDALKEGTKFGVAKSSSADYHESKTKQALRAASANVGQYRTGAKADLAWTDEQRKQLK
jgi:Mg-chelatase subunit ChlD